GAPAPPPPPPLSRSTTPRPAASPSAPVAARPPGPRAVESEEDEQRRTGVRKGVAARPVAPKPEKREIDRRQGRLTLGNALLQDDERNRSLAAMRRRVQRNQRKAMGGETREKIAREVVLPEAITIQELANRMSERGVDVIRLLMKQGQMHKITDVIDADTAQLIAEELGHSVRRVADSDVEEGLFNAIDDDGEMQPRPPVVTIMGHVDHGKTSLLDALRKTNVVSGEAGGITQHIGAYQVVSPLGGKITFVDTPGHAAFTAMRARGAKVTDIVVLVIAADDGVKPQTVEAIAHAKAAKAPIIVAINKIDKPDANPLRARTELLQHDIQVESLGGETLEIEVSAKTGHNLDKLLEAIQLQAELLDLRASADRLAEAYVVEAKLDRGRGPVASAIISRGTLKVGDIVVAGAAWGRVRALMNDAGQSIPQAGPSMPVEILGFSGVPEAGDRLAVVENEARAREIADYRDRQRRDKMQARLAGNRTSLTDMMTQIKSGAGRKEFILVVKGDVQGSVEAIAGSLDKLGTDEVGARIIHSGVGGITESDVTLAAASGAVIIGFNVRASREAREVAERDGIEIRYYNIIYDLVDDVKKAMTGLLAPTFREEMLGNAAILEVFNISKIGKVAGCRVTDGEVQRGANVRLIRDNVVIHEGKLSQLKRFKDDAKEVTAGQECGMSFENYQDMRAGDVIECYRVHEVQRTL
ncbi:translation initiation factor IF-2, partial [Candidatus Raskinella chloraquaticus]|uniref:translation initiation factor IF-2 n=1 Tax=Candidatus Raskinella chloraquaticus TaxID=1951219 RepID=UPI00366D1EE0